ncbi:MAG: DUF4318 domain-containing protein [Clostridium perfringens]|nr:DUF4318 domain-containing protein [Clostridium perfringens]MDU7954861.1 DUF4318 domain-containing protein [Clostridium perfringens]MDU7963987.1 DUF4318 domain-containing protein [Clostridium perfringens]
MRFFRKAFVIELKDSLQYPSSQSICDTILKQESNVEFISKEKPVIFKLDNVIYEVEIKLARGGYELICKELK